MAFIDSKHRFKISRGDSKKLMGTLTAMKAFLTKLIG